MSPAGRLPPSVGQTLSPTPVLRSPAIPGEQVRSPSPNYFGLVVEPSNNPRDSNPLPKSHWSPNTSSIFSFGGGTPEPSPLNSNPDFEAFKKQSESTNKFSLSHGGLANFSMSPGPTLLRSKPERKASRLDTHDNSSSPRSIPRNRDVPSMAGDVNGGVDSSYESSSERAFTASINAPSFFDLPLQTSPAGSYSSTLPMQRHNLPHLDERHPRLSLPHKPDHPSPRLQQRGQHQRADTLPLNLEDGPAMITPVQLKEMMDRSPSIEVLLLDCRTFSIFSQSRIGNALNMCIPTTLLKRPSFNLQKLQDTFTNEQDKIRFSKWKQAKYIIAYDNRSSDKKDAALATYTLKKFTNEGWNGVKYILKGGFDTFAQSFPNSIDWGSSHSSQPSRINLTLGTTLSGVIQVAGGCAMPITKDPMNPFFSNIRQNQDLIDGVGQRDIEVPEDLAQDSSAMSIVPRWLSKAAKKEDHGKIVSDRFLHIEKAEQARMTRALKEQVRYGNGPISCKSNDVRIAGLEKGSKNRYNNIWPFEHARVKLTNDVCDYVNASHVKASRSNKRYIASQGPLPETFGDFWSVIWDQDVRVIVMLTAEREDGQLKCHSYWSSHEYGHLKLKLISEKKVHLDPNRHRNSTDRRDSGRKRACTSTQTTPLSSTVEDVHVIVRKFTLSHAAHLSTPVREITQVHYSSWPDCASPAKPSHLLALIQLTNSMQRASSSAIETPRSGNPEGDITRPMLVHCSAGCGRTGTFCTIDSVIDMLKRQRKEQKHGTTPMEFESANDGDYLTHGGKTRQAEMDWIFDQDTDLVEKTVEDFRCQRLSMVQNLMQYVLCYETILEWISQQVVNSGVGSGGGIRGGISWGGIGNEIGNGIGMGNGNGNGRWRVVRDRDRSGSLGGGGGGGES
ncbi:hypothetical protein SBOR_9966 [Sclerotinia borealis F-4128]|uniref:protein-tyrosine-phosphatase n=1 Tax=Sclerotinia borealis (strain F-4128) TaxID=1432307 RepID=W9C4Y9_SCLBF|nr:hypothetical protein SBOR_9966 [Sclerotinia borealis F-4128]